MSEYNMSCSNNDVDTLRLEGVITSVGFDDLLDVTLEANHPHFDTLIVVTSFEDEATQKVAKKYGATCVPTDLFQKNERNFNKGAAINAGFNYFQYRGWRMHLDSDIILPDNFRRIIFNHSSLDKDVLYGADRIDLIGRDEIRNYKRLQYKQGFLMMSGHQKPIGARFIHKLHGYCPLGYFQLWHNKQHKPYPYSLGTAAHDDIMFATLWPEKKRALLPSVITYHCCPQPTKIGENWDGFRQQPRL